MARRLQLFLLRLTSFMFVLSHMQAHAVPWLPFGPDGGSARRLAADPRNPTHLYLGAANGWIYESKNFGQSWTRLASVGKRDDLVIDSIVVDAKSPGRIIVGAYATASSDGGIFISSDGGRTWLNQAEMRGQSVRALAASLSDPATMIAGTLQGVFRTVDGGQRWKQISPIGSVELHNVESIAIDPKDASIIYAGTWHLPWKTTDGGEHWENIKNGIIDDSDVFSIIVDPVKPEIVYASACSGIYKSLDAGMEFKKIQGIPTEARRTRVLLQDPNQLATVFAGTTEGLFRSDDAGKIWTRTTGPELIVYDVLINAADSRQVLLATERAGVLASDDGGDTFHSANAGFSTRQITAMKRDKSNLATLYVGVINDKEWGGVFRSDNGGLAWRQRSEGLQGSDVFALGQASDGTVIAGTAHGIYLLKAEAQTWERATHSPASTVSSTSRAVAAAPASMMLRPPVPIGRDQFAQRKLSSNATPAQKRAAVLAARRKPVTKGGTRATAALRKPVPGKGRATSHAAPTSHRAAPAKKRALSSKRVPAPQSATAPQPVIATAASLAEPSAAGAGFDGAVYSIVTSGEALFASTSTGLLRSDDNGTTWADAKVVGSEQWRLLTVARQNLLAATLHTLQFSADGGATWVPVRTPETLTQISAIAVEPNGELWVGGLQGVFVSSDAGITWTTPKNLFITSVANLFYDEATNRVVVTTAARDSIVFTVQLPQKQVSYAYSGWSLRFARPMGDHLVGATLFDGIVIEPKMMDSPVNAGKAPQAASPR